MTKLIVSYKNLRQLEFFSFIRLVSLHWDVFSLNMHFDVIKRCHIWNVKIVCLKHDFSNWEVCSYMWMCHMLLTHWVLLACVATILKVYLKTKPAIFEAQIRAMKHQIIIEINPFSMLIDA